MDTAGEPLRLVLELSEAGMRVVEREGITFHVMDREASQPVI